MYLPLSFRVEKKLKVKIDTKRFKELLEKIRLKVVLLIQFQWFTGTSLERPFNWSEEIAFKRS